MSGLIFDLLFDLGIRHSAAISLSDCRIIRPYKLEKAGLDTSSELYAVMMAVPYLTPSNERNISAYAAPRDYHFYFKSVFEEIIPKLKSEFPQYVFAGFADDSPIIEADAAAKAGLGIIGDNGLLITPEYSSFVFLGEIITDMPMDTASQEIAYCEHCGACRSACPTKDRGMCLSELTQKKGELSDEEKECISMCGSAWGCDICQNVCPHTKAALNNRTIYTDIPFFKECTVPLLSENALRSMTNEEFALRAYSWRKRATIERNIKLIEAHKKPMRG